MTIRFETWTCGAASPAPSWSAIVSNMSSISRWISGAPMLSGALALERIMGRLAFHPAAAVAGLVLVAAGVLLHGWARRTLGPMWSGVIRVRAQHVLVERGPYRLVRHPIYLAGLLLALGTFLAHPSLATTCLGGGLSVGVVVKGFLEDRALRAALGGRYEAYAARVPAFVPRLAPRASLRP